MSWQDLGGNMFCCEQNNRMCLWPTITDDQWYPSWRNHLFDLDPAAPRWFDDAKERASHLMWL